MSLKGRRVLGVFSTARKGESGLAGLQRAGEHSEHRHSSLFLEKFSNLQLASH